MEGEVDTLVLGPGASGVGEVSSVDASAVGGVTYTITLDIGQLT